MTGESTTTLLTYDCLCALVRSELARGKTAEDLAKESTKKYHEFGIYLP